MDLKHECEFLSALSPLPQRDKCWRDFEKDGDWNDALYPHRSRRQAQQHEGSRPHEKSEEHGQVVLWDLFTHHTDEVIAIEITVWPS